MKNFLVLVFLLISTRAYTGVWYYGTGEAVSLENQLGFENSSTQKFKVDGITGIMDLISPIAVRMQTENILYLNSIGTRLLDPQITTNTLLLNGDFESSLIEYACTDATGAIVAATLDTPNNNGMFQMTVTGAGGYCDFIYPTGTKFEGLPFKIGGLFQTELVDVEYCTLVNGVEDNCIPVSAIADDTTDPFNQPFFTQSLSGATSAGVRIKTTVATSGVINLDKLKLELGGLPTSPTVNCESGLDCENKISSVFNSGGTIISQSPTGAITSVSRVNSLVSIVLSEDTNISTDPSVLINIVDDVARVGKNIAYDQGTRTITFNQTLTTTGANESADRTWSIGISKQGLDYKSLTQQGAVNIGTASGALVHAVVAGGQSIGTSETVFTLADSDISEISGFSFTDGSDEFTALKAGKYELAAMIPTTNSTNESTKEARVQIDTGSGYVSRRICGSFRNNPSSGKRGHIPCIDTFRLNSGDKIRLSLISGASGTTITADAFATLQIRSVIDQQTIAASVEGVPKIEGEPNKVFVQGGATFAGGTVSTVCSSNPCTRYNEVGNVGRNMSVAFTATGTYELTSTGWAANVPVMCTLMSSSNINVLYLGEIITQPFTSDGSGVFVKRYRYQVLGSSTANNTTFRVHCTGQKGL
jgi:hypothetical protein